MTISEEFGQIVSAVIGWIPDLIKAILIIIIGWIVALILKSVTKGILSGIGLNRRLSETPADSFVRRITNNPTETIASFVYWLAWIVVITIGIGALGIPVLSDLVRGVYSYVPNILAAIIILVAALALSLLVTKIIGRWLGDTVTGKIVGTAIPAVIMGIAIFAVLEQLKIAPIIVATTYIAFIGSVALGLALAFGLGGRDVAARLWERAYERGSRGLNQAREDIRKGSERAEQDIRRTKERLK